MEESAEILGLPVYDLISMVLTVLLVLAITAIITIQFMRLRKQKDLFKRLSDVFKVKQSEKITNKDLVEKIILFQKYSDKQERAVSDKVSNYVQLNLKHHKVFIHFTSQKQNAEHILKEGFKYSETIYKTSQEIINSSIDLTYKLQLYRPYGSYLILLCVPKELVEIFNQYKNASHSFSLLDNVLSELNPKNDLEYTLPLMFVRGYVNMDKNVITENELFLKDFNIEDYKNKLQNLLSN